MRGHKAQNLFYYFYIYVYILSKVQKIRVISASSENSDQSFTMVICEKIVF